MVDWDKTEKSLYPLNVHCNNAIKEAKSVLWWQNTYEIFPSMNLAFLSVSGFGGKNSEMAFYPNKIPLRKFNMKMSLNIVLNAIFNKPQELFFFSFFQIDSSSLFLRE